MTNGRDFDEILSICLDRLQKGDTVEACLVSYPGYAGRLAPLLYMIVVALSFIKFFPQLWAVDSLDPDELVAKYRDIPPKSAAT